MWDAISTYWPSITFATAHTLLMCGFIAWILSIKKESTSAIAWSLLVILVPLVGAMLFVLFGYQSVNRPLKRKMQHRVRFRAKSGSQALDKVEDAPAPLGYEGLAQLAERLSASSLCDGNRVELYYDGRSAFDAMFAAIEAARHHVHVLFFIFRNDQLGGRMLDLLRAKARSGVEVRLLVDGIGARKFSAQAVQALRNDGGKFASFLPVSLWRRSFQVNLRNHRKIVIVDGSVGFTGGLNVGDEYLGGSARFGPWRDTFLQMRGPAVEGLQGVFVEDWDFASSESLQGPEYFPSVGRVGEVHAQVISSGPDTEIKPIREIYFAAMLRARRRLWVTTPYYVPDQGIRDALCLSALSGVDVRLLLPKTPDHWMPYFAGRYYLPDLLAAGVKIYRYTKGFIHAKVVLTDGQWASVGTANLDNRSLLLNFEVNCLFHSPNVVGELERQFLLDLDESVRLDAKTFSRRPWPGKLAENVCRLFAPVL